LKAPNGHNDYYLKVALMDVVFIYCDWLF